MGFNIWFDEHSFDENGSFLESFLKCVGNRLDMKKATNTTEKNNFLNKNKMGNNSLFMKKMYGLDDKETKDAFQYLYERAKKAHERILESLYNDKKEAEKELEELKSQPREYYLKATTDEFNFNEWARKIYNLRYKIDNIDRKILVQRFNITELFDCSVNPSEIPHGECIDSREASYMRPMADCNKDS